MLAFMGRAHLIQALHLGLARRRCPRGRGSWDRQSGPKTWRSPGLSPPRGPGGTSFCFTSVSGSCPTTSPYLHTVGQGLSGSETYLNHSAYTTWARAAVDHSHCRGGRRGLGPRAGQGEGTQGKEMGADPRGGGGPCCSPFSGPVVISWRAPLTGLAILRPKLHVHPLVSSNPGHCIGGSLQGHHLCVSRINSHPSENWTAQPLDNPSQQPPPPSVSKVYPLGWDLVQGWQASLCSACPGPRGLHVKQGTRPQALNLHREKGGF